jgi:hypothetical protein
MDMLYLGCGVILGLLLRKFGKREWIGLTDEERYLNEGRTAEEIEYARAIEAKLKEKNT